MKTLKIHHYIFYSLLALSVISSLSGCGFQLKQSPPLPASFGPVSIQEVGKFSSFYKAVRDALRQSSINIVEDTKARHTLIIRTSRERKVLAVNTEGKVSEYELIQRVNYSVISSSGTTLITPTRLSRSTYYTVSNTEILGDATQEIDIYQRLEQQLVDQMFKQISVAL